MGRRPQWILATTLLASCTYPRTEIDVRVDTDLAWGTGAAMQSLRIELRVGSAAGEVVSQRSVTFGRGGDRVLLPVTFAMSPRDQDATRRVWIQVHGCHGSNGCGDDVGEAPLVTQRALVSYVRRETRRLDVFLASRCVGVACDTSQRCDVATGVCVGVEVPVEQLRPVQEADAGPLVDVVATVDAPDVPITADAPDVPVVLDPPDVPAPQDVTIDAPMLDRVTMPDVPDAAVQVDAPMLDRSTPSDTVAPPRCGDGTCQITESCATCAADCGACPAPVQRSCTGTPTPPGCGVAEIPGATFIMGSDDIPCGGSGYDPATCVSDARPAQRNIAVSRFYMDRDEVTVARFRAFWMAGHPAPSGPTVYPGGTLGFEGTISTEVELTYSSICNWNLTGSRDSHPMNCVNWATAQSFCVWDGGRLPTEAEWELAARGVEGRTLPWGNEAPTDARACWSGSGTSRTGTCPVGSSANGSTPGAGLRDMAGNVWEWLADWYAPYSSTTCWGGIARTNPICRNRGVSRSYRGGSWFNDTVTYVRPAARTYDAPATRDYGLGFRCSRSP